MWDALEVRIVSRSQWKWSRFPRASPVNWCMDSRLIPSNLLLNSQDWNHGAVKSYWWESSLSTFIKHRNPQQNSSMEAGESHSTEFLEAFRHQIGKKKNSLMTRRSATIITIITIINTTRRPESKGIVEEISFLRTEKKTISSSQEWISFNGFNMFNIPQWLSGIILWWT